MAFEEEYQLFINGHLKKRTGERLRRLKEGHSQAEKLFLENVWWPCFHQFQYLHPEYEVEDFKDGKRYLDIAYIRPGVRVCFEIDGYSAHLKNVSRWQFADNLERQNHLVIDRWTVIRFSYDQVVEHARRCQNMTQLVISRSMGVGQEYVALTPFEKEVVRLAMACEDTITPSDISKGIGVSDKTARKVLADLVKKGMLSPAAGKQRIRSYRLKEEVRNPFL